MRRVGWIACAWLFVLGGCGSLLGIESSDDTPPPAPLPPAPVDGSEPDAPPPPPTPEPVDASDAADVVDAPPFDCAKDCNTAHCSDGVSCDPLVFVTSVASASDGSLGGAGATGVARADARCNVVASAALLKNPFKAWISDETTDAKTHVPNTGRPLRRRDGAMVAPNIAWLSTTNALSLPVQLDESGNDVGAALVWTGTSQSGTKNPGSTCTSWTSSSSSDTGQLGVANATSFAWVASSGQSCGTTHASIYCIEIPP